MMIRAAGGPGPVSPLDFNERKQPLPRATWIAIGVVAAAHLAVGVVLYYQRFELAAQPVAPERTIEVSFETLPKRPEPKPTPTPPKPAAPNAIHETPVPAQPTETLAAETTKGPPVEGITITTTHPVTEPVETARPATISEPPAVITNPSWIRQPSASQMMQAYPTRALTAEVAGSVSLNCAVRADGAVGDCAVTRETPGNYGFGRAAQGLSRYFRINPRTVNGAAVDGARVNINLRFNLPAD